MDDEPKGLGWWTLPGETLLAALHAVKDGHDPDLLYAEMYANSHIETFEDSD